MTYSQPAKNEVRQLALNAAVTALTTQRSDSCCIRQSYVREARDQLLRQGRTDREHATKLKSEHIRAWESFHRTEVGTRDAKDLTVAYLCGPEPRLDFETLSRLGVQPHNIWAFESQSGSFERALASTRANAFGLTKLIRSKLDAFLASTPRTFDIIYLDACGPLPSVSQKTLRTLTTITYYQRLRSPGVLLTNFAEGGLADGDDLSAYTDLIAAYLFPKDFLEEFNGEGHGAIEGASSWGYGLSEFRSAVAQDYPMFYSQFITRLMMDIAAIISPSLRASISTTWKRLFKAPPPEMIAACLGAEPDLYDYGDEASFPLSTAFDTLTGGPAAHSGLGSVPIFVPGSS